ncbi:MAG: hypothetical protein ACI8ZM_005438 [Crocinitomix sp.]|jgi:hypothetical protein
MEILVKQITKEIDEKPKTFFLDEKGNEYQIDWADPRFENAGFQLKEASQFNNKTFNYKGKCKLLALGEGNEFEERHIFLDRKTKHRYYINPVEFAENFEAKVKA